MVNIVMIAKNRYELTRQAIMSLNKNTDPESYNLTFVDDGSVDKCTLPAIPGASLHIYPSRGIVGLVRNIGADFAERYWGRGDWLYFSDNDVYFHPGWLEKMLFWLKGDQSFSKANAGWSVVGGCRHPFHRPIERISGAYCSGYSSEKLSWKCYFESTDAVAGYSMLMSWETWDKYGPFDQHAKGVGQSEDFAVCQKVVADGFKVGYVSPPVLTVCGLTNTLGEKVPGYEALKAMVPDGVMAE